MKKLLLILFLALSFSIQAQMNGAPPTPPTDEKMEFDLRELSKVFESLNLDSLPMKDRGRLKPLDTLARETNLYLTGKKSLFGATPSGFFLALHLLESAPQIKIINVRSVELRELLKLEKKRTTFSLAEIEQTELMSLLPAAQEVEKKNKNLLTPIQSGEIELSNQVFLLKSVMGGDVLFTALVYKEGDEKNGVQTSMQNLLSSIASKQTPDVIKNWSIEVKKAAESAKVEKLFENQRSRMSLEVSYNSWKLFFFAGLIYFILSFINFLPLELSKKILNDTVLMSFLILPLFMLAFGFGVRIYITEFPPVTNMYGTMVWVSFGISLFSFIFYLIYRDRNILAIMSLGAALLLILTENIPLIISPSMDPIVAVLRSSYWLTIHVLTVTISYAAFSMAMILGNIYLIRSLYKGIDHELMIRFSHYAYRAIQLGVLLLTAGIILGGVWADYSWGRFWGWDPKETWALIADLGFLAILHGRFAGWISPKRLLVFSPVTYLLVVMAWFGVNFILATGLHSYGFSSGGTFMVITFMLGQLGLYVLYYSKSMLHAQK
jgi:ABC-type transport system involved in cytochrome c biogenesis permease subunit